MLNKKNSFFSTILLPQEMCLHHPGCFYYILETVLHSSFTVFMFFCHENKVWYWVFFVIPPLPVRIETASYPSASEDLVLILGSGISRVGHSVLFCLVRSILFRS